MATKEPATTKVKFLEVQITKNPMMKVTATVPQWEAHVLMALWGDNAEIKGEKYVAYDIPEAKDEFQRLADKYGPKDEDIPVVAKVYGSFGPGLRALDSEVQISIEGSKTASEKQSITERANASGVDISRSTGTDGFADLTGDEVAA